MATPISTRDPANIEYPDSDGLPMADNTLQFRWIVTVQGNLDGIYRDDPNVFVAGDLLWYPVEFHPEISAAPDTLVAFGRPKGYRGSYKQWVEAGIAPQVVFEIMSPNNRPEDMDRKFQFYERHGVEEYYLYDPDTNELDGWLRRDGRLQPIPDVQSWVSPRLGIRFDLSGVEMIIYRPDGKRFLTFLELLQQQEEAQRQAEEAKRQAEEATRHAERLAEKLRSLGIDPDQ
jgi:Uma2 family endonuclease